MQQSMPNSKYSSNNNDCIGLTVQPNSNTRRESRKKGCPKRLELKDTRKHKIHNIQPQHEHGGTRVSGSFSSVSSGTYSGTSERVVVVRKPAGTSTSRCLGRRRTTAETALDVDLGDALTSFRAVVEHQLFRSLATSSRHLSSTTEQRLDEPPNVTCCMRVCSENRLCLG